MRTTRNAAAAAALAVLAAAPLTARAHGDTDAVDFVVVRGGFISLQDEMSRNVDMGPRGELAVRRQFYPFLQGELAVGYSRTGTRETTTKPYPDPSTYNAYLPMHQELDVIPVTVAIRGVLPKRGLEPYLVLGAGMYFATLEDRPVAPQRSAVRDRAAPFGVSFGVGADAFIAQRLFLNVEGRYQLVKEVSFFNGDRWSLNGVTASLGLGYRL